jgi:hypothetical protein
MPALQDASHPDHVRVSHDLYCLQYKLFCEAFDRPLSEWCHAHGLLYSGEKLALRMSQLRWMDIPGCEPGHTKAGVDMDLLAEAEGNAKRRPRRPTSTARLGRWTNVITWAGGAPKT